MRINYISNNNPKISRITSMDFLNAHDLTLLLTGTGKDLWSLPYPTKAGDNTPRHSSPLSTTRLEMSLL